MKIVIEGKVYDDNATPVVLIFENDAERKRVAEHLSNMPEKSGVRAYASYPKGLDGLAIMKEAIDLTSTINETTGK